LKGAQGCHFSLHQASIFSLLLNMTYHQGRKEAFILIR
jgi:hypothetical protein